VSSGVNTLHQAPVAAAAPERAAPAGPCVTLWLLRAVVTMFLLVVLAQPVLAGLFLSGEVDAIGVHALNADLVIMLAMAMSAAALLFWTVGRGRF